MIQSLASLQGKLQSGGCLRMTRRYWIGVFRKQTSNCFVGLKPGAQWSRSVANFDVVLLSTFLCDAKRISFNASNDKIQK